MSVEHHVHSPHLIENEVSGLIRANNCKIPCVVKYEELIVLPDGDVLVVLEVVCDQSGMLMSLMHLHQTVAPSPG